MSNTKCELSEQNLTTYRKFLTARYYPYEKNSRIICQGKYVKLHQVQAMSRGKWVLEEKSDWSMFPCLLEFCFKRQRYCTKWFNV